MIGQTLGHYRIESKLGEGGMGEVYKALDIRLNRFAAIKVLRTERIGPEHKRRFVQEAQAASALNHPNIVHVYSIDSSAGVDFIAMEYVAGKTLTQSIPRGGLAIGQVLAYSIQIADALAVAHAAGIVHRDIKPGNIMLTDTGLIKILDFGLAKLPETAVNADDTTRTLATATSEGALLGTMAYMSPEQAEGKKLDARSDIFGFGALLYEMVTGRRAFSGDSTVSILASILREEPAPARRLREGVPRELEKIILRCLRKDPMRRVQIMTDVKLSLEEVRDEADVAAQPSPPTPAPSIRLSAKLAAPLAIVLAGMILAAWAFATRGGDERSYRFKPLATEASAETWPSWSSDGKTIAYVAQANGIGQIFVRGIGAPISTQVTKAASDCEFPFWHPDGNRIFYNSSGHLWSVRAVGGEAQLIVKDAAGGTISPDGQSLAFVRGDQPNFSLWISRGGKAAKYDQAPFPQTFREVDQASQVLFAPDGSKIGIALSLEQGGRGDEFWIVPYPSGKPRRTLTGRLITRFSWLPDSRHVVVDADTPDLSGRHLYLADTEGNTFVPVTSGTGEETQASVSPDGSRIAFVSGGTDYDLVEARLDGGPARTLLATSRSEWSPAWAPSGSHYAYSSNANGVFELWLRNPLEGWVRPAVTRRSEGLPDFERVLRPQFSADGQSLAFEVWGKNHSIWVSTIAGERPVRLESETSDQHGASWSPDGNWIAYFRLEGKQWAVARAAVGGGNAARLVQTSWGGGTAWSPSGEWICYNSAQGLHLISPDGKTQRTISPDTSMDFAFSKDGSTLYVLRRSANRKWEVAAIDVKNGRQIRVSPLDFDSSVKLGGFSLHPNEKEFATTIGRTQHDIWLLEGFRLPAGFWDRLRHSAASLRKGPV